jgi:hypothetical protein
MVVLVSFVKTGISDRKILARRFKFFVDQKTEGGGTWIGLLLSK